MDPMTFMTFMSTQPQIAGGAAESELDIRTLRLWPEAYSTKEGRGRGRN